jgi:hypothetical protein
MLSSKPLLSLSSFLLVLLLPWRVYKPWILVCKVQLQIIKFLNNIPRIEHDTHQALIRSEKSSSFLDYTHQYYLHMLRQNLIKLYL